MLKIPKNITNNNIMEQIDSLNKIYEQYKNNTRDTAVCPLCTVGKKFPSEGFSPCSNCPWIWFSDNKLCFFVIPEFLGKTGESSSVRECINGKNKKWVKYRMPQIKRWIESLNNELYKRGLSKST